MVVVDSLVGVVRANRAIIPARQTARSPAGEAESSHNLRQALAQLAGISA